MPVFEVNSPEYWVEVLDNALTSRQQALSTFRAYYDGDQPLLFTTRKFQEAFGPLFKTFSDNWCQLVVDAVDERLRPEGFRIGTETKGDKKVWDIWQRNQLDADSQLAHTDALSLGDSYALVWPDDTVEKRAAVTVESAEQVICAKVKGDRRNRAAALKVWIEEDEYARATLYTPQGVYKLISKTKYPDGSGYSAAGYNRWEPREVPGESFPINNPFGVVPVVPLINNPTMLGNWGISELVNVIPIQDAVNKLIADMIVASEFGAFRQKWATGLEIPVDPETNQKVDEYRAAIERMWTTPNEGSRFGTFEATDLQNFVTAIEMLVQHIASQTRTPPHYFYLRGQFPSGESIKSAETGLVAKARRKMRWFGEAWEEVMSLALEVEGSKAIRKQAHTMETIWGDPESRTESEHVDAVIKQKALNVPDEILWEKVGYSPQEIDRMQALIAENPPEPDEGNEFVNGFQPEEPPA
jgi:hypothetical protein